MRASVFLGKELHRAAVDAAKQRGISLSKLLEEAVLLGLKSNPDEVFSKTKVSALGPPKSSIQLTEAVRVRARRFSARGGNFQSVVLYGLRKLLAEKKPTAMAS